MPMLSGPRGRRRALLRCLATTLARAALPGSLTVAPVHAPAGKAPRERHRPLFHFTPPQGWMNDPNGLVFENGRFHLFYQYHPASTVWGPMHWGHALSRDLVRWQHLPVALTPEGQDYVFSGSAVRDDANTAGFGAGALVAMFTVHDMAGEKTGRNEHESQHIASSTDHGLTWQRYAGNPVLPNPGGVKDIRDPKLVWHAPSAAWIAALAVGDHTEFWGSPDLKQWQRLGAFGAGFGNHDGVWECPDLFELPVEGGAPDETKWVLLQSINPGGPNGGSATQYFIGDFDGREFRLDAGVARDVSAGKALWIDQGRDNSAGVTWSGVPGGERIFIGWMSNWDYADKVPTAPWRSAMTLPTTLHLLRTAHGLRLASRPVAALASLRQRTARIAGRRLATGLDLRRQTGLAPTASEMEFEFELPADGAGGQFGVELSNARGERYRIGFDSARNAFFSDRTRAGPLDFSAKFAPGVHRAARTASGGTLRMHLFFDVASAELFADDGVLRMTDTFFPSEDFVRATLFVEGAPLRLLSGRVHQLA